MTCCSFRSPDALQSIASSTDPKIPQHVKDAALKTIESGKKIRDARNQKTIASIDTSAFPIVPSAGRRLLEAGKPRAGKWVLDLQHTFSLAGTRGIPVRWPGQPESADPTVNEAWNAVTAVDEFFHKVFNRNSINDGGQVIFASVHYGLHYTNCFWDGVTMLIADGDGVLIDRFSKYVEVIGHEICHGIIIATANLTHMGMSGALNESICDVFGIMIKQWLHNQTVHQADWLMGAHIFLPAFGVRPGYSNAFRSFKAPGTTFEDTLYNGYGQVQSMDHYVNTSGDDGGVHVNSGIPNHAFYLIAVNIGGYSWERAGQIWYKALTDPSLQSNATFQDFANLTVKYAGLEYGNRDLKGIVMAAWYLVGVYRDWPLNHPFTPDPFKSIVQRNTVGLSYTQPGANPGIFDFKSAFDRVIAFDFDGTGKLDHLLLYRPGHGLIVIVKVVNNGFRAVFTSRDGLPSWDLLDVNDHLMAYDHNGNRQLDHLLAYRPGSGSFAIFQKSGTEFELLNLVTTGFGDAFPLDDTRDLLIAFDIEGDGRMNDIVGFRPGGGLVSVLKSDGGGNFSPVSHSKKGIGTLDFLNSNDRIFAIDYTSSKTMDHLIAYRSSGRVKVAGSGSILKFERAPTAHFKTLKTFQSKEWESNLIACDIHGTGKRDHVFGYGVAIDSLGKTTHGLAVSRTNPTMDVHDIYVFNRVLDFIPDDPLLRVCCFDYESKRELNYMFFYGLGPKNHSFGIFKIGPVPASIA
jgi:hypothetical protein